MWSQNCVMFTIEALWKLLEEGATTSKTLAQHPRKPHNFNVGSKEQEVFIIRESHMFKRQTSQDKPWWCEAKWTKFDFNTSYEFNSETYFISPNISTMTGLPAKKENTSGNKIPNCYENTIRTCNRQTPT